ncbi:MAG: energy-coupling factor ABC transporter ATP-binding protein, partial [Anaerovoracaceae bacterium]
EEEKKVVRDWHGNQKKVQEKAKQNSILKIEDLTFSYSEKKENLSKINLEIMQGEMMSIVGKNGAGKSTLAKIICAFERPDTGKIFGANAAEKLASKETGFNRSANTLANLASDSIRERAELIGQVMQNPNQMISKNLIYDEVALSLRLRELPEEEIKTRVEEILKVCGLSPFIDWPISALSYGQKKRVTIASILVLKPEVIILDEPTAGQDYKHYTEIMEFLAEINRLGITVILITHDMHLMLEYTPRAVVLCDGEILADKTASEVLTDTKLIEKANLKETSLYYLAQKCGIKDETAFVNSFINYEATK